MLIRKYGGSVFHIVCGETRTEYLCLCGQRIFKNDTARQRYAEGSYVRCWQCRKLEHARLARRRPGLKIY